MRDDGTYVEKRLEPDLDTNEGQLEVLKRDNRRALLPLPRRLP